ncbi:MAG: pyridoxal-phosphate dependent enzyme [Polyangiales bacterium]
MSLSRDDVLAARERIAGRVHNTPVFTSSFVDERAGCHVYLKCENFQKVGAFKARGATNAVQALSVTDAERGVATHSSGNHGAALAFAARARGIRAFVVMPRNAPRVKRDAVVGYGAEVVDCDNTLAARESTLADVVAQHGATEIHPYNNEYVIAGQGTAALELVASVPQLECIAAPIGGGGLISGSCLAAPNLTILGAEPKAVDDAARSLASGVHAPAPTGTTIADGLRTRLGELAFGILRGRNVEVRTLSEDAIVEAMRFIWERTKLLIEPSSAVPLAALFADAVPYEHVGVILSGGNVDLGALPF